jgi:hypothetical protein
VNDVELFIIKQWRSKKAVPEEKVQEALYKLKTQINSEVSHLSSYGVTYKRKTSIMSFKFIPT